MSPTPALYSWPREVRADRDGIETYLAWLFTQGIDYKLAGLYVWFRSARDAKRASDYRYLTPSHFR